MKKVIAVLVLFSTMVFAQQKGTFTDPRDNKTYKTVKIVSQTWMAENLNYAASYSECYDNDPRNCMKYGRLYDWKQSMRVCPSGWHLPSYDEWDVLMAAVGGNGRAGQKLRAKSGWIEGFPGMDDYGFSALPGGSRLWKDRRFYEVGERGFWWSATEVEDLSSSHAYDWNMSYYYSSVDNFPALKSNLFSVRCVMD